MSASSILASGALSPGSRAAPRWRTLGALAALVLLAHGLVLRQLPSRFGPANDVASRRVPAFVTRSIPLPPTLPANAATKVAMAPAKPAAKPAIAAVRKPFIKQKAAVSPAPPSQVAITSIATSLPEPAAADAAAAAPMLGGAPPATGSASASTEVRVPAESTPAGGDTAAAATATPAAIAPVMPGPSQTPVTAMALPASARLDYQLTGSAKGLTYHAKGELAWRNTGSSYDARLTVSALFIGSRIMTSTGQVGAEGLSPGRFSDRYKTEVAAHFDAGKDQIIFSANTPVLPLVKGAQDRVSVVLQLGGMLAGNPAGFPAGSMISMYTVGPRDADSWTFRVEGDERLALPIGELATIKVARQPQREYDQKVEVWYAPSLGYLPVRSKITQANGDYVDQQLGALERP